MRKLKRTISESLAEWIEFRRKKIISDKWNGEGIETGNPVGEALVGGVLEEGKGEKEKEKKGGWLLPV